MTRLRHAAPATRRRVAPVAVALALLLAGCSTGEQPPADGDAGPPLDATSDPEDGQDADAADADDAAAAEETPAADQSGDGADPGDDPGDGPTSTVLEVSSSDTHPAGVTVTATRVEVADRGLLVTVRVDNAASEDALLAAGADVTYALDDTGRRLELVPPEGDAEVRVPAGGQLDGTLAFEGTPDPDATSFVVRFNHRGDRPLNADGGPGIVSLELVDLPLVEAAGDSGGAAVGEVAVDADAEHPSGATLRVSGVRTDAAGGVYLDVVVDNPTGDTIVLANNRTSTYLRDATGRQLGLRPPQDDPRLEVPAGRQLTGEIAFVGPLAADAGSLRLFVNASPDNDQLLAPGGSGGVVSFLVEDLPVP